MYHDQAQSNCLILDPNPHYQRLVKEILRFSGSKNLEVGFAENIDKALLVLSEGILGDRSVNVLVMEAKLPIGDAAEFIRRIRRGKTLWSFDVTLPIIGYADGFTLEEIYLLRDAGISELMVKPLSAGVFFKCLRSATARKFIKAESFCGPDRRRRHNPNYPNMRRADDRAAEQARIEAEEADRQKAKTDAEEAARQKAKAESEEAARREVKAEAEEAARRKAKAEAEETARQKARAEAEDVARQKDTSAAPVDPSAMTQEQLAQYLSQKKG